MNVRGNGEGDELVDPVTLSAVLLAIVSGVAGEAGGRLWAGISALVRRPFRRGAGTGGRAAPDNALSVSGSPGAAEVAAAAPAVGGAAELAALERSPDDRDLALVLARVLLARADADAEFGRALGHWWEQAADVRTGEGNVTNTISGGAQHGPVLQGRDFTGLTFGSAPAAPPPAAPVPPAPAALVPPAPAAPASSASAQPVQE